MGQEVERDTTRPDTSDVAPVRDAPTPPEAAPLDRVEADEETSEDTSESGRAIVNADSLSATEREGLRVQELFNDVSVKQDTTRLHSEYALRYLTQNELVFTGDVVIYERGDTLQADTVRYNKGSKVGRAFGNVRLTDGEVDVYAPRATYYTREKRTVFPDSVTLVDSSRTLTAAGGTYWSDEQRADFQGNVQLTDPDTYLEADSLTYFRPEERSIARSNVFIRRSGEEGSAADTTARSYLFGDWADNQEQSRYSRVEGQALLVRVRLDSAGAPKDTLVVRARQLEAHRTDTYRRLIAVDSVRVWQTDLAAVADSAVYDRVIATGRPDTSSAPDPRPDTTMQRAVPRPRESSPLPLDSLVASVELTGLAAHPPLEDDDVQRAVDTETANGERTAESDLSQPSNTAPPPDTPGQDSVRTEAVTAAGPNTSESMDRPPSESQGPWETPVAASETDLPFEETRLFRSPVTWFERAQVWGDSIRVQARDRTMDTVYVRGSAFAAQEDTTLERIQQLKGRNITAYFRRDSLRRILARPNGQAIRFSGSEDGTLNGASRASADYAELRFSNGEVETVKFGAGVQGTAYHEAEHVPDPFHLEGFQWTPERKPTKADLLRDPRVRERLGLEPRRGPPLAGWEGFFPAVVDSLGSASDSTHSDRATGSEMSLFRPFHWPEMSEPGRTDSTVVPVDSTQEALDPRSRDLSSDTTDTFRSDS